MDVSERGALLALLLDSSGRWSAIADEVEEHGSALQVMESQGVGQQSLFGDSAVDSQSRAEEAEALLAEWERDGMHFSSLLDDDYPYQLLSIHQRPPVVMWSGI